MSIKWNSRGDTIIEVLFAMAIIGVVLGAAYATASRNLQTSQLTKERTQATNLAESQIEQLKMFEEIPSVSQSFCIDLTQATPITVVEDDSCTVDEKFEQSVTKNGDEYQVLVEWIPPGGSADNKARVEMLYRDFDFDLLGSSTVVITNTNRNADRASVSVRVLQEADGTVRGVVYGTTQNPRLNDGVSLQAEGSSTSETYSVNISGLDPAVTYYVRAFVETSGGIKYSTPAVLGDSGSVAQAGFSATTVGATVSTTSSQVRGSATIVEDTINERGFVFSTQQEGLDINNNQGIVGASGPNNDFTASITGLVPGTRYYYRAYATNSINQVAQGDVRSFVTSTPVSATQLGTFNGSVYYVSNNQVTASQARTAAALSGGHLVKIESQAENDYIAGLLGASRTAWIGANDRTQEGNWVWHDGTPLTYTNWASGEPNNWNDGDPGEDDAVMNWGTGAGLGRWNDWVDRDISRAYYVIEYPQRTLQEAIDSELLFIGELNGSRYYRSLFPWRMRWSDAHAIAQRYGGHLASINNQQENNLIANSINDGSRIWIGANDIAVEGTFVWTNGDPFNYTNWHTNQPDNWREVDPEGEDYVHMYSSGTRKGRWNDIDNLTEYLSVFTVEIKNE